MSSFPWRPETEKLDQNDLVLHDSSGKVVAVAEIKGWWSNDGLREVPGILRDIRIKLQNLNVPGIMLILTSQAKAENDDNLRFLGEHLSADPSEFAISRFDTAAWQGYEGTASELLVIGFFAAHLAEPAST
jgi:hypothetical protein